MLKSTFLRVLFCLGLSLGASAAAATTIRDAVLGFSGEVYVARRGLCHELFTDCAAGTANAPLLAVEIQHPTEPTVRLRVPETDGMEVEGDASLVFEDASDSLFVVWESKTQVNHSRVNLAWLKAGQWSEVYEVSGDIYPLKGPPQVAITRDYFEIVNSVTETATRFTRTAVHISWWEKGPSAEEVYYTPIFLIDGNYLGKNQVYNLSDLDPGPAPTSPVSLPSGLIRSPRIEAGSDGNSSVIGFANPATGRFLVFDLHVLPAELGLLADQTAREIKDNADLLNPDGIAELAARARGHMIEMGYRLHPGIIRFIADDLANEVQENGLAAGGITALANKARGHMIEMGARSFVNAGMDGATPWPVEELFEIRPPSPPGAPPGPAHHVWLRLVNDRTAPGVGSGPVWMFLSENGQRAIVSWEQDGDLRYRETRDNAWTAPRRIDLDGPIDAARAEQILRQRVRER